jgi:hypothetical protein
MNNIPLQRDQLNSIVTHSLARQKVCDMHTHLYPPSFGTPDENSTGRTDPAGLLLWGVDELLTYHYLVAEVYRIVPATKLPTEQFWKMDKSAQADHIWKHLFLDRPPISEACRGVLTALNKLGLDPGRKDLKSMRKYFKEQDPDKYIDRVMELSNVSSITMTNAVFDDNERARWNAGVAPDSRFQAVLRIDPMLRAWPVAAKRLSADGYAVDDVLGGRSVEEAKRFLRDWLDRMNAIYIAVSLPPEFRFPTGEQDSNARLGQRVLEEVVMPVCEERGLPFAMMIGSRMRVNPELRDAGDMGGLSDVMSVVNLCRNFPRNRFLVTMLARENQHDLCVAARKFGNLMVFGCWWFLNNPSLIEEITRMRFELLGSTVIPQHSDARVLDQLLYKWDHSRAIIGRVMSDKYADLAQTGWPVTAKDVQDDCQRLLSGNFQAFASGVSPER